MKPEKIDPALMRALQDFQELGVTGLQRHVRTLGLARVDLTPKPPSAIVFVHCAETADLSHLADRGIVVNQRRGKVRTGIVPLAAVDALTEETKVRRVLASRTLRPLMDVAPAKVGLPAFQNATGLSGNAVVIGIIDTGIDADHPDFQGLP